MAKMAIEKLAYSMREAIEATTLSRSSLEQLIERGRLNVIRVGRRVIIPAESLRGLFDEDRVKSEP